MKTFAQKSPQIETIHGFRVLPASPISKAFGRALKRLSSRGYLDPSCVIVKTKRGSKFGAIPVDGKFVLPSNPLSHVVLTMMRDQGIEPPPMPFVFAPGATTLFHEWGHHVDLTWSGSDHTVTFSTRWFSHFYEIRLSDALRKFLERNDFSNDSDLSTPEIIGEWHSLTSELFADLFEDWMRDDKKVGWDCCDPDVLNRRKGTDSQFMKVVFLNNVSSSEVREKTYSLFKRGFRDQISIPGVRSDFFRE